MSKPKYSIRFQFLGRLTEEPASSYIQPMNLLGGPRPKRNPATPWTPPRPLPGSHPALSGGHQRSTRAGGVPQWWSPADPLTKRTGALLPASSAGQAHDDGAAVPYRQVAGGTQRWRSLASQARRDGRPLHCRLGEARLVG